MVIYWDLMGFTIGNHHAFFTGENDHGFGEAMNGTRAEHVLKQVQLVGGFSSSEKY